MSAGTIPFAVSWVAGLVILVGMYVVFLIGRGIVDVVTWFREEADFAPKPPKATSDQPRLHPRAEEPKHALMEVPPPDAPDKPRHR